MRGSYSCRCSATWNGQRMATQKLVCTMPKKWLHLWPNSSQDIGVARVRKYVVDRKFQGTSRNMEVLPHCSWLTYSSVIRPPDISSDRAIIAWTVGEMWKHYNFLCTSENKKIPIKSILVSNLQGICQWYEMRIRYLHREERKTKSKSIPNLSSWHWLRKKKKRNVPQARGDPMLHPTENRETLIRRTSEQASFASGGTWTIVHHQWIWYGWKQFYSFTQRMTGIEVFKFAGTLVIEVQEPSQQPWNPKPWVRTSRGIDKYAQQFLPTETYHQHSEAASSQQSVSCGWPRVGVRGGHSPVRYKLRQGQSLYQLVSVSEFWNQSQPKH